MRFQDLSEAADERHHVRGGDQQIAVRAALFLNALDQVFRSDDIRTGRDRVRRLLAAGEDPDDAGLAGAEGQVGRAAHHLIAVARIDAQVHRDIDGLVELRGRQLFDLRQSRFHLIDLLGGQTLRQSAWNRLLWRGFAGFRVPARRDRKAGLLGLFFVPISDAGGGRLPELRRSLHLPYHFLPWSYQDVSDVPPTIRGDKERAGGLFLIPRVSNIANRVYTRGYFSSGAGISDMPSEFGRLARCPTRAQTAPAISSPHRPRPRTRPRAKSRI